MNKYFIEYDIEVRRRVAIRADSPESAIEQFWADYNEFGVSGVEVDSSGPTDLSMQDASGRTVIWGERTDLS